MNHTILKGSPFHLLPSQLRTQIESNISPELAAAFDHYKDNHDSSDEDSEKENDALDDPDALATAAVVKAVLDALKAKAKLQSFINTLTKLDQKLIEDRNACKRDAKEAARSLKWSSSTIRLSDRPQCAPYSRGQTTSNSRTQTSSSLISSPPKLTDHERKYLETYNGCKKCHGFYMPDGHPCEFPVGDGYIEHMMATMNEAHKRAKLPPLPIPRDEHALSVNMVNISGSHMYNSAPPQPSTAPPALPVAAVLGMSTYPIASVCPPNDSSILGGGDSDLSCDSNDLVSTHVPFFLPHLVWDCAVKSLDPSCLSRMPVSVLIDHGSPPVLIDEALVAHLCLPTHLLPMPFPVSGAFFNDSSCSPHVLLTH
jgi:hypothetical protein